MRLTKLQNGRGIQFSLEIFDEDNRRLEKWRNMLKDLPRVVSIINDKYDLDLLNNKNDDLKWAK